MEYFKIDYTSIFNTKEQVLGNANGEFVPNGKHYFDRMGKGEIIYDAPLFDYFHLQSFGKKEDWEWKLQDVHGFTGEYPTGGNWYVSDKFKKLLEGFFIAGGYHFYPTKLLYKGVKLDYWIFQFPINPLQNIDYIQSEYFIEGDDKRIVDVKTQEEFSEFDDKIYRETKKKIIWKKNVFTNHFDMAVTINNDRVVSKHLKQEMIKTGITGLEFKEPDYDIEANDFT